MGCCISHPFFEKETVYEVTLDADGVAQRVPKGQGTHFIHISSKNGETHLEEKTEQPSRPAVTHDGSNNKWPSLTTPPSYNSKVAPVNDVQEKDQVSS
ncbi:uncharacterized protein ATC70_006457 [Mucor velutinosus]|uniref:Uncharacterized protein n=1 Tax=Mucor velutinosus TaxID=708070 RepID=A0AAN7HVX4_9FUNG|nr:hypothetical protein ATC70_006457 [Mucor velutinosus]